MKSVMAVLFVFAWLFPAAAGAACEVVGRSGELTVVAVDGGECRKGEPLRGASQRMGDMVLASERFCEAPKAEHIEAVKNDGAFARRFYLRCTYVGSDCSPGGTAASDIVFLH